jgi:HK97 family phage major capsid protein
VRHYAEVRADQAAAETKRDSILEESRAITVRLQSENRTADDGEQERLARLRRGVEKSDAEIASLRAEWAESMRDAVDRGTVSVEGAFTPSPQQRTDDRPAERRPERDAARRAIENLERSKELAPDAADRAERLLSTGSPQEQSISARWAASTGDPAYSRAFLALLSDPVRGHLLWTPQEADAYRRVAGLQSEMRLASMTLTDANGGWMVPLHLDPAIVLSGAGTTNAMRKVSRVVQTASESWQGVTSAGSTAEWIAEATQVAEAGPVLAAVPIPVYKGDAFVSYSFEVGMDALNFAQELQRVLADAADTLMATAYTVGTGGTQPTGIVVAKTATDTNAAGEALAAADALTLQAALAPRFSPNAKWMAHIAIINALAAFETTNGNIRFPEIAASGRLLGKPIVENSDMDNGSSILASETASNYVLLYGDFSEYRIVDRIGSTIEIIPNLMGAAYRPTGQRGALLWFRTGGNVSTTAAFQLLDVHTTA